MAAAGAEDNRSIDGCRRTRRSGCLSDRVAEPGECPPRSVAELPAPASNIYRVCRHAAGNANVKTHPWRNLFRADSIATALGASVVASVLTRTVGVMRGIALAWLIPPSEFGLFGVALLVVNVLLPLFSAGLYEGAARYAPAHEAAGTLRRFAIFSAATAAGLAMLFASLSALSAGPIGSILFMTSGSMSSAASSGVAADVLSLTYVTLGCAVALAAYHTLLGLLKGLRMFRAVSAAELSTAGLFTALALAGALHGWTSAAAIIAAYAVSCVVVCCLFAPGLIGRLRREPSPRGSGLARVGARRSGSALMTYSLWAAATAILWHALSYYPMWYLQRVSDHATVGAFHAVRIVTQFVHIAAVLLTSVAAANVNRLWENGDRTAAADRLSLLTRAALVALLIGAIILTLARPLLMQVFPSALAGGDAAFGPMVLFFLLVGVVGLLAIRLNLVEKPRLVCLAWLAGAAVNVLASYLLLRPAAESAAMSESQALVAAAWSGVSGAYAALAVCVLLAWRQNLALDMRSVVLLLV